VQYYRTREGRIKKEIQNGRRSKKEASENSIKASTTEKLSHNAAKTTLDEVTLNYFQMVTSLIERRPVGLDEILLILSKVLRQHSMERGGKSFYTVKYSRGQP
jgi:hypothetical protein